MSLGIPRRTGAPSVVRLLAVLICAALLLAFVGAAAVSEIHSSDARKQSAQVDRGVAERLALRLAKPMHEQDSDRVAPLLGALDVVAGYRVTVRDRAGTVVADTAFDRRGEPGELAERPTPTQVRAEDDRLITVQPIRFGTQRVGEVELVRPSVAITHSMWFWRDFALLLLAGFTITGIAVWSHHHRSIDIVGLTKGLHRMLDGNRAELSARLSAGELAQLNESVRELDLVLARGEDRVGQSLVMMAIQMVDVLERRGQATPGHGERTARYAEALADRLGLSQENRRDLDLAARLHELGKLWVRTSILTKSEELTTLERESFRQYPVRGADAFEGLPSLRSVAAIIRHHRERYDGGGFPEGLRGERIPLGARILTIASAYDQLTSCNFQGEAVPWEEALASMREDRGVHFDPTLLEVFEEEIRSAPTPAQPDQPVVLGHDGVVPYKTGEVESDADEVDDEDLRELSIEDLQIMFEESPDDEA